MPVTQNQRSRKRWKKEKKNMNSFIADARMYFDITRGLLKFRKKLRELRIPDLSRVTPYVPFFSPPGHF